MCKKPDKRIQAEYDRIAKGPHKGWFTLLHHEGPVLEYSHDVIERLNFILSSKPKKQKLVRLINIVHVDEPARAEYEKVMQSARAECEKVKQSAFKKLNPRTTWNGTTIFSK